MRKKLIGTDGIRWHLSFNERCFLISSPLSNQFKEGTAQFLPSRLRNNIECKDIHTCLWKVFIRKTFLFNSHFSKADKIMSPPLLKKKHFMIVVGQSLSQHMFCFHAYLIAIL